MEDGFDEEGTFFYIPFSRLQSMVEIFRHWVIKLLVERELLNEDFARTLLTWEHSGFSIDNSVRILDESSQESLAEHIARPPISLKKIRYEPLLDSEEDVGIDARKRAGARLLAKVYEVCPLVCPKCRAAMKVIAIIEDTDEIKRILRHLVKIGRPPCTPGTAPASPLIASTDCLAPPRWECCVCSLVQPPPEAAD